MASEKLPLLPNLNSDLIECLRIHLSKKRILNKIGTNSDQMRIDLKDIPRTVHLSYVMHSESSYPGRKVAN